jgi:hypothetical protein
MGPTYTAAGMEGYSSMRLRDLDTQYLTIVPKVDLAPSHGGESRLHVDLSDPFREYESGRQPLPKLAAYLREN